MKSSAYLMIAVLLVGCAGMGHAVAENDSRLKDDEGPVMGNSRYSLTPEELAERTRRAEAGDAGASFGLYQYYAFTTENYAAAAHWLKKSAERGNRIAQYNLSLAYSGEIHDPGVVPDEKLSRYWLEKAAEGGYEPAREKLDRYHSK